MSAAPTLDECNKCLSDTKTLPLAPAGASQSEECASAVGLAGAILKCMQMVHLYNNAQDQKCASAQTEWDGLMAQYNSDLHDWSNAQGAFSRFASRDEQHSFYSDKCFLRPTPGYCSTDVPASGDTDAECVRMAVGRSYNRAEDYRTTSGRTGCPGPQGGGDGCAGVSGASSRGQHVNCNRPQWSIDNNNAEYNAAKPVPPADARPVCDSGPYKKMSEEASYPTIACCQNTFVANGNLGIIAKNIQTCEQQINSQSTASTPASTPASGASRGASAPVSGASAPPSSTTTTTTFSSFALGMNAFWAMVVALVLLSAMAALAFAFSSR
jgi:hypothetical protein